jgi:hypothetical protein
MHETRKDAAIQKGPLSVVRGMKNKIPTAGEEQAK